MNIEIDDFTIDRDGSYEASVNLDMDGEQSPYSGFQFDINLPSDISVTDIKLGDSLRDFKIEWKTPVAGLVRVVAFANHSSSSNVYTNIATITFEASANVKPGSETVKITNAMVSKPDATDVIFADSDVVVTINVPVTSITVTPVSSDIYVGGKQTFTAEVLPADATDRSIEWSISPQTYVTTVENGTSITVTGKEVGNGTVITATSVSTPAVTGKATVNVLPTDATIVELNKYSLALQATQTEKLIASVLPENTTDKTIVWESDNQSVATVAQDGTVTAVAVGKATITATCGSASATCLVTVNPTPADKITLSATDMTLLVGQYDQLEATVSPENTTDKTVTWKSDNEAVATVSADGTVTGVSVGVANITATCGTVSATCKVTVNPVVASGVTLNVQDLTLLVGQSDQLEATVSPENTTDKTITWRSDNEAVATVNADGTVTGVSIGVTNITATCGTVSATCKVTVNPVVASGVTLNVQNLTLLVGQSDQLRATVSPENTTDKTVTWKSDNEAVATVSADGTVTGVSVGVANITATCGTVSATCKVTVNPVMASGVTLNVQDLTLLVGQSDQLKATVSPDNTTDKTITWKSDNEAVVTVSADGTVTGVSVGVANITATCGTVSATCKVTVNPVLASSITLNVQDMTLLVGQSDQLRATVSPENTTDKTVTWKSDNEAVATVSADGTVTGVSVGVANITATCGTVSATCKVTVNPVVASGVTLNVQDLTLLVGQSDQLKATVSPDNTTDKTITWKSDNEAVATVSADGTVTGVSVGVANITATCGTVSATCKVTVNPVVASGVTLNVQDLTLLVGQSDQLEATVSPDNTTDKTITWKSDNEAVATVNADGTVTGVSVGVANITATCGTVSATCKVTVNPVVASGITLNIQDLILLVGQSDQLKATVSPENTTDKTVTWKSDNEAVATVSADGTVTGISVGVANITATCGEATANCKVTVEMKLEPEPDPDDPEPEVTHVETPTQLLRKGDGTSHTFVAMMETSDEVLEAEGYRYVFGYDNSAKGAVVLEDTPWRYTYTTKDIYWNAANDFWVFAYYTDRDGKLCVSSRRHLDGSVDTDFDPMDFIGANSRGGEHIVGIYTLDGQYMGKDIRRLESGIYVIRTTSSSYKLIK